MRIANDTITVAGVEAPISMGASFTTDAVYLAHIADFAIQLVFTGSPAGTFTLEASCDKGIEDKTLGGWNANGVSNWSTVLDSDQIISAAGTHMWNIQNCGYRWVRINFTRSGSTGSLTSAVFNVKGI